MIRAVFTMSDVDAQIFPLNVFITEVTDFTNTKTGRIHESNHSFRFEISHGRDKCFGLFFCRDKGQIGIKPAHRELCVIPGLMKNVKSEKTQLGNGDIDRTVRKIPFLLKDLKKPPLIFVRDLRRRFVKGIPDIIELSRNISLVRFHCMVGKTTKRNHFFVGF